MAKRRDYIPKDNRIAACLLELWALKGSPLPFKQATAMTAAQICALVEWHHLFPKALGGSDHPTNISPLLVLRHRAETKSVTQPIINKAKRRARKMASVAGERSDGYSSRPPDPPKRKWPKRTFAQQRGRGR